MKRIKQTLITPRTRDEAETIVGQLTELIIAERETKALMDQRVKEIKDEYQAQLVDINERITPLYLRIEAWAEANLESFGRNKSLAMLHGVIGWRTDTPSLKTRKGWTWDRVLETLGTFSPQFIRTKEEVDKQAILAARENLLDGDLKTMGVEIVQQVKFFVEPAVTPTEDKVAA